MEKEFGLYNLSDDSLDDILSLTEKELHLYIHTLIQQYYKHIIDDNDQAMYTELVNSYKSSFVAERFYRSNLMFQEGFQAVYTKTGLIRNIVSDLYFNDDHLITH